MWLVLYYGTIETEAGGLKIVKCAGSCSDLGKEWRKYIPGSRKSTWTVIEVKEFVLLM